MAALQSYFLAWPTLPRLCVSTSVDVLNTDKKIPVGAILASIATCSGADLVRAAFPWTLSLRLSYDPVPKRVGR